MACIFGNALLRLSAAESPAKTPVTMASMSTAAASVPILRAAKWNTVSSPGGRRRAKGSARTRRRPAGERRGLRRNAMGFSGTRANAPS